MTLAWAIIIVAILYLLDKHHLLRKALVLAGILAGVLAIGFAGILGYQWLKARWETHVFEKERVEWAKSYECFDPATGKTHAVNKNGEACELREVIHARGTPLPVPGKCHVDTRFDDLGAKTLVEGEEFDTPQGKLIWDVSLSTKIDKWCIIPTNTKTDESNTPIPSRAAIVEPHTSSQSCRGLNPDAGDIKQVETALMSDEDEYCSGIKGMAVVSTGNWHPAECRQDFRDAIKQTAVVLAPDCTSGLIVENCVSLRAGSGGCPVSVLAKTSQGYRRVLGTQGGMDELRAENSVTNGFYDLTQHYYGYHSGHFDQDRYFVWNGSQYELKGTVDPPGH